MIAELTESIDIQHAAVLTVLVGAFVRFYFGHVVFHPRYVVVWDGIRTVGVPILNRIAYNKLGVRIENHAVESEFVAEIEVDELREVALKLNEVRDFEVPLLAGYKEDWDGNQEVATLVSYHGGRPFGGMPHWLRDRQLHITFFETAEGKIRVTAHEEANSYRPDQWKDHFYKGSMNEMKGVEMTERVLRDAELIEV